MPKVHLLEDELINKIAAGEVVERPASVLKELVENAVDAGASQIEIELNDGGKDLVSVRDNGSGMQREDAVLAIKRHCTSKIATMDDLSQINSMGFRGEALASISSVSRFSMTTRTADCSTGTRITFEDGTYHMEDWSGDTGTTIAIKDLFFNVPARRSFLKSNSAEFAQCHELVQSLALSLPRIGFVLKHNGREYLRVAPLASDSGEGLGEAVLQQRLQDVLNLKEQAMIYGFAKSKHGQVEILMSPPGHEKATAKHIFMFVNGRWVKDKGVRFSILRGYHSHLLKGRFPVCVLHFSIDPSLVDVNVHPSKAEVRFQYHQEVQNLIALTIRDRLRRGDWASQLERGPKGPLAPLPPVDLSKAIRASAKSGERELPKPTQSPQASGRASGASFGSRSESVQLDFDLQSHRPSASYKKAPASSSQKSNDSPAPSVESRRAYVPSHLKSQVETFGSREGLTNSRAEAEKSGKPGLFDLLQPSVSESRQAQLDPLPWGDMEYMGAFGKCYLFFGHADSLYVLDQHAFHERILYERLKANGKILKQVQPLLMPESIPLSPIEIQQLRSGKASLEALGFAVEFLSDTEVEVRAVPDLLKKANLDALLSALAASSGLESDCDLGSLAHDVLSTMACHSAVRAGEELPEAELEFLLNEARDVDFYHNCPHGRPVLKVFSKGQVAGWFER